MPSLVFMLWLQDPLHQKKDLNLAGWTGWNEMETGREAGELIRLSEQAESSAAGGNMTRAADREDSPLGSQGKVWVEGLPHSDLPLTSKAQDPVAPCLP